MWRGQRAALLLGGREVAAEPFAGNKTASLSFIFRDIPAGQYFVRLRVDGVESILIDRTVTPPKFDATQQITIS